MKDIIHNFYGYLYIYSAHFARHKANIFAKLILIPINMFVLGVVWYVLAKNNKAINLNYVLAYYFIGSIISSLFPFARFAREMQDDILYGNMSNYLVRPSGYIIPKVANCLSWSSIYLCIGIPISLIVTYFLDIDLSMLRILSFIIFIIGSVIISMLIWMIIGLLSFWTGKNLGVIKVNYTLTLLLNSSIIPFVYLPNTLQSILSIFPYKYLLYIPVNALISQEMILKNRTIEFMSMIIWIFVLIILVKLLMKRGVKRYESNQL